MPGRDLGFFELKKIDQQARPYGTYLLVGSEVKMGDDATRCPLLD